MNDSRIESGSIAFGSDWPGLFLRGDDAYFFGAHLKGVLDAAEKTAAAADVGLKISLQVLRGLVDDLLSVDVSNATVDRQQLRSARECLAANPTMRGPGPEQGPDCDIEFR